MLFTNDPKFRIWPRQTPLREANALEVRSCIEEYGLALDQIHFVGGTSHYVAESTRVLDKYFSVVQVPPGATIFSDQGHAFKRDGVDALLSLGASRTAKYPPIIHHHISPNDNTHHGRAKGAWRQLRRKNGWGPKESVRSSLCLLGLLTHDSPEAIMVDFQRNLFLGMRTPPLSRCLEVVRRGAPRKIWKMDKFREALRAYKRFMRECSWHEEGDIMKLLVKIPDGLDGQYYS